MIADTEQAEEYNVTVDTFIKLLKKIVELEEKLHPQEIEIPPERLEILERTNEPPKEKCPHCGHETYHSGACLSCGYGFTDKPILKRSRHDN